MSWNSVYMQAVPLPLHRRVPSSGNNQDARENCSNADGSLGMTLQVYQPGFKWNRSLRERKQ
jgi:hypothetical protein